MTTPTSREHHENLGFRDEVRSAFAFLEEQFGFQIVQEEATRVRYESPKDVFVNVYFGRSSYELKFEIGRMTASEEVDVFYPDDVAKATGFKGESYFQASTAARVRALVPQLAGLLCMAKDALSGDVFAFKRLRDTREKSSKALMMEWRLADARQALEPAWRSKDFKRVVGLLEPLEDELSESEREKLHYARARLGELG